MKLKDVINKINNRLDWIHFYWGWDITDNGDIIPQSVCNINMDSEVSIHYQWFHHCNPKLDTDKAWEAIEKHDYETFYQLYEMFEVDSWIYFPEEAYIFIGDECVGELCIAYDYRAFSLIDFQDCECG